MKMKSEYDDYEVDKLIAENTHSIVVSAHTKSDKVAIKCIPLDCYNPNEPEIMFEKKHPHIIKLLDSFQYDNNFFAIVMPLAQYDLDEYIKKRFYLPENEAKKVMADALDAVKFLHFDGIWHRDIKLENMFVMSESESGPSVVIGDFGLACSTEYGTVDGPGVGTDQFAAPELIEVDFSMRYDCRFKEETKCLFWEVKLIDLFLFIVVFGIVKKSNQANRMEAKQIKQTEWKQSKSNKQNGSKANQANRMEAKQIKQIEWKQSKSSK